MPNTMGALFIYNKFVAPYFKKYEDKIDKAIEKLIKEGKLRGTNKQRNQLRKEAEELMKKEESILKEGSEMLSEIIN